MIVGLTGSICSGKETLAKYLVEVCGFEQINILDLFKQKIMEIQKAGHKDITLNIELRSRSNSYLEKSPMKHFDDKSNTQTLNIVPN